MRANNKTIKPEIDTYGSPTNGPQITYHSNGKEKSNIFYKNGLKLGPYSYHNEIGKVIESGYWEEGQKYIEKEYFSNGMLKNDINYELGTGKRYDSKGLMVLSWRGLPGDETEIRKRTERGGLVKWCEKMGKKTGIMIERNRVGLIINKTEWENGKLDGRSVHYFDNGLIKSENSYKGGALDGPTVVYYDDGNLMQIVNYKSNTLNGKYLKFYKDGLIKNYGDYVYGKECYQGEFKDGKLVDVADHRIIQSLFTGLMMSLGIETENISKLRRKSFITAPKELSQL